MLVRVWAYESDIPRTKFASWMLIAGCLGFALGLTGCNKKSELRPAIVVGGSMEPAAAGEHLSVTCHDCEIRFRFDRSTEIPLSRNIVCPNCGDALMKRSDAESVAADRVQVDPNRQVKRWDLVAFQMSDGQSTGIKRVVGLPGELLEIRDGNIFSGGEILRKPLAIQMEMRIPVHDSNFTPESVQPRRWRPAELASGWRNATGELKFRAGDDSNVESKQLDWLVYHHWRCFSHSGKRDDDFPVEDSYGFNQSLRRNLNETNELFVEMSVEAESNARFGWRLNRGPTRFEFGIDIERGEFAVLEQTEDGKTLNRQVVELESLSDGQLQIEFSSFDAQLIANVNGQLVFQRDMPAESFAVPTYPLAIGAAAGAVSIKQVRIYRDIFYFPKSGQQQWLASDSGFLMLGDNVPISVDSRHWGPVMPDDLIGVVH